MQLTHNPSIELSAKLDGYTWPTAILIGSLITYGFFMTMPNLGRIIQAPSPTIIELDFVAWQPPKKTPPAAPKPEPKKPKHKPKPKPKPVPKPEPKPAPKPPKKKVLTEKPEPPKPVAPPEPVKEIVEPTPPVTKALPETAEESLPEPAPLAKLTAMPRFIHQEQPVYPHVLRAAGREGVVRLELLIDAKGVVRKVTVLKSAGDAFDEAAIAAMKNSSFAPAEIEGKAVAVKLRLPIKFRLR